MEDVTTSSVVDKLNPKWKYKFKKEKEIEAKEAKVYELAKMGKEMVGEELHFEDIENIWTFVAREGCPPKEKKKSRKKGIKVERKDASPKQKQISLAQRKKDKRK